MERKKLICVNIKPAAAVILEDIVCYDGDIIDEETLVLLLEKRGITVVR